MHLPAAETFLSLFSFRLFILSRREDVLEMAAFDRKSFRIPQVQEFKETAEFRKNALISLFMARHLALHSVTEDREPPRSISPER